MNTRERVEKTLRFEKPDRLPAIEWATWWDKTLLRWQQDGLTVPLDSESLFRHFGLDSHSQIWVRPIGALPPLERAPGEGRVRNSDDYSEIKPYLYPENPVDHARLRQIADRQAKGETVFWITLEGFFWYPRTLFGIEPHLYAFYDHPELMHRMNEDLLQFHLRVLDEVCAVCTPVFMTFAEDMSYNHGPMCSREAFDEFIAPYYRRIVPRLLERGIVPVIDSDGDVTTMVPWFESVGVQGFLPLERMAGVDISALREKHPRLVMIGAFDKTVMHLGEAAIRKEFDRLLPVMKQGGYIPSVDHQTPPAVSMDQYRLFVSILKEYCELACR